MKLVSVIVREMQHTSHPSRGAWIEITTCARQCPVCSVAPLTGCVD